MEIMSCGLCVLRYVELDGIEIKRYVAIKPMATIIKEVAQEMFVMQNIQSHKENVILQQVVDNVCNIYTTESHKV